MIGEIFAICSVLSFVGSNAIFHKIDADVSPSQINAVRTIIGALTYIIIALIIRRFISIFTFPAILWLWLGLSFLFGQVFGDTAYFKAQEILGTTIALAVSMTFPIFTTILSFAIFSDIPPFYFYISLVLTTVGVLIIAFSKRKQEIALLRIQSDETNNTQQENNIITENEHSIKNTNTSEKLESSVHLDNTKKPNKRLALGIVVAFIAAISWAAGLVLTDFAIAEVSLIVPAEYSSLLGNVVRFPIAAGILSLMAIGDRKKKVKEWTKFTWLWLIIGSIIGTSIGAYLYTEAILRAEPSIISIISSSSPLFAIPISWLVNKEKITLLGVLGVIITIIGVINIFVWEIVCAHYPLAIC
ncbi:MAG: DMT family transporter [Asgard group archaeon]|nr:DMT family transporter [Asgard group archaeon]